MRGEPGALRHDALSDPASGYLAVEHGGRLMSTPEGRALTGSVELLEGMAFSARTGSGFTLTLDAASDVGGNDRGPRPMELILLGLGGCTAMDVISILRKMRQEVTGYEVLLRGERVAEHPKVYQTIVVEHVVRGRRLKPDAVRRAIELSNTRYCPASAMLRKTARIDVTYRLIDEDDHSEVVGALE